MTTAPKNADPNDVQGEILVGAPKKVQAYYFFRIQTAHIDQFRKHLANFIPSITTTTELIETRKKIAEYKQAGRGLLKAHGVSLAFSHKGLELLGLKDQIDKAFNDGMLTGAAALGDAGKKNADGSFDPDWDPVFKQEIHGLITIGADSNATLLEQIRQLEHIFCVGNDHATIHKVINLVGQVRPGKETGHEHFGFNDGVSQPAVDTTDTPVKPVPGQDRIRQGIILLGRDGDVPGDITPGQKAARPSWTLDGSFLAFRYLPQLVPEFDGFLKANPLPIPGLSAEQGSELLGARLVGRWKSGAPIDVTPLKDDPALAADPQRVNDFNFSFPDDPTTPTRCPFAAHVRKTNPRNDLTGHNISTESRRILRRGIAFGPEVSDEEHHAGKTAKERGLLFACYQSNIENGFQFIQQSWANNAAFPPFVPQTPAPGIDPIIGQVADPKQRVMSGTNAQDASKNLLLPTWVESKGGEYFFAPSIPVLKKTFAAAH